MCGVCGVMVPSGRTGPIESVGAMASTLVHRGPDRVSTWVDPTRRVAFGHTRLAIVDLSPAGNQPMTSRDRRWTITYNGEIYNAPELRRRLSSERMLRGHSDTEVLVELIAERGVQEALRSARGMFAFAVWDARESELWLARDRFGEKPLYYSTTGPSFLFASELKALRAVDGFRPDIDRHAVVEFLRWTNVPAPLSIYEGVSKLPPGHFLRIGDRIPEPRPEPYWSASAVADRVESQPAGEEAVDRLEEVLERSVAEQMVSDVPIGAFLSGGVDSSSVVAMMQRRASRPVRTFTIGFEDSAYDESSFAARVAAHLGTDHTDLRVSPVEAMGVIPTLSDVYDEPFADSSQIPTVLVSRLARESVTVALSGDGGDELFGGYERYRRLGTLQGIRRLVPAPARRAVAGLLSAPSVDSWDRLGGRFSAILPEGLRHRTGHRVHKAAALLAADQVDDLYRALMSVETGGDGAALRSGPFPESSWPGTLREASSRSPAERAMLVDTVTYLPDDLLVKVDRAAMSVSLEVRVPFLSPEVFDFAWGLQAGDRIRGSEGKWVVKRLLGRSLPDDLISRPKMGFGIPVGDWLRGPLRDWADDLLSADTVRRQGLFNVDEVVRRWSAHREGSSDLTFQVWALLMFQSWLARTESER